MSYTSLDYHVVFSTKERRPFLKPDIMARLLPYLGGVIRELGGKMLGANGPADHLHLVVSLPLTVALADFVGKAKAGVSKWIHQDFGSLREFAWQDGYAAFTVSRSVRPTVLKYVAGQEEHHRKMSFKEELAALLKRHGIEYNARYL